VCSELNIPIHFSKDCLNGSEIAFVLQKPRNKLKDFVLGIYQTGATWIK